jgi:hypothetical protein
LLYNSLNKSNSFDFNWVKTYYKINSNNIDFIYNKYKLNNYYGNNVETNLGWKGLADNMIEHSFERLPFSLIKQQNMNIYILNEKYDNKNKQIVNYINNNKMVKYSDFYNLKNLFNPTLCIISCHTNTDYKINTLISNLKYFMEISDHIIIINSNEYKNCNIEKLIKTTYNDCNENIIYNGKLSHDQIYNYKKNNPDLMHMSDNSIKKHWEKFGINENRIILKYKKIINIDFSYTENNNLLCHGKWCKVLSKININDYKFTILTNDSFLIVNSLVPFKNSFNINNEMFGLCDSYETKYHIPDFIRCYNNSGILKIYNYYKKNAYKIRDFFSAVLNFEINSTNIFKNIDALFKMNTNYNKNMHYEDEVLKDYLYNRNYPIIKLKKLLSINYNIKNSLPVDFDCNEYKNLNIDLQHINNLEEHFFNFGIYEGRHYKKNQKLNPPEYITNVVNKILPDFYTNK